MNLASLRDDPARLLALGLILAVLAGLVIYPLALVLGHAFLDDTGHASLYQFGQLVQNPDVGAAAIASLWFMVEVSIGSVLMGVPLAWATARTDMPGKILIRGGAAISFVIPSFINVIAWIFLAAPNSGYLNKTLVAVLGLSAPPFNVFSFGGLVFIETAHLFPLVYFAVATALANVDASHEQAARVLGAGRLRTAFTVTLPLVLPAIISSTILVMLEALSSFGAPAAIGTMANFTVLSTLIYQLLTFPPHMSLAAAVSVPVALFTLLLLWLQQRLIQRNDFTALTGKASAPQLVHLGLMRWPLLILLAVPVACLSILPLAALVTLSLLKNFGAPIKFANFDLSHYRTVFDSSFTVLPAVEHSLVLAVAAATICVAIGIIFAWMVERMAFPGRGALIGIVTVAFGIPSIILGIGVLLGYIGWLYGTLGIILIAYAARHLPIAFVYVRSLVKQLSPELEEVARVSGSGWLRTLKDVTFPVLRPGAFVAWLLIFSLCLREQPMSAILTQASTQVMSTSVLQFLEDGSVEVAAAISVLIVVVSVTCLGIAQLLGGRRALH